MAAGASWAIWSADRVLSTEGSNEPNCPAASICMICGSADWIESAVNAGRDGVVVAGAPPMIVAPGGGVEVVNVFVVPGITVG